MHLLNIVGEYGRCAIGGEVGLGENCFERFHEINGEGNLFTADETKKTNSLSELEGRMKISSRFFWRVFTDFLVDEGFDSSRRMGRRASRNLRKSSSSGSPSWTRNKEVTMAANLLSDSLPFLKELISSSVMFSVRFFSNSERYFWENKVCNVRNELSRVRKLDKFKKKETWGKHINGNYSLFRSPSIARSNFSSKLSDVTTRSLAVENSSLSS